MHFTFSTSLCGPRALVGDAFLAVWRHAPELGTLTDVADVRGACVAFHAMARFVGRDALACEIRSCFRSNSLQVVSVVCRYSVNESKELCKEFQDIQVAFYKWYSPTAAAQDSHHRHAGFSSGYIGQAAKQDEQVVKFSQERLATNSASQADPEFVDTRSLPSQPGLSTE